MTILLTLVGIALCFVWRRKGDVVHLSEEPAAWWWRGDVPGRDRSLAGTRAHAESFDDDLDEELGGDLDLLDRSGAADIQDEAGIQDDVQTDAADATSDDVFRDPGFARPEQPAETSEPTDPDR